MAVLTAGTSIFLVNQSHAATISNTITKQGTKLNLINNNTNQWEHTDLEIVNATTANGTKQTFYISAWIKPGENTTIDLSNMLGFNGQGNNRLDKGTQLTVLSWSGLYSPNGGSTGNFIMSLQGWSNTENPTPPTPMYSISMNSVPIGTVPSKITDNTVMIGTNPSDVADPANDVIFTQMLFTVDPSGNLIITFPTPPTLCQTIAEF